MLTNKNGDRIPTSYCTCGARPRGNGAHAAHRKMHIRKGDGHRPATRDVYDVCMSSATLRFNCDCGAGDRLGREHRADPPCPTYSRWLALTGPGEH